MAYTTRPLADLMYAGVDEQDPEKRRLLEEELALAMAHLQSNMVPANTRQTLAALAPSGVAETPVAQVAQAPVQRGPVYRDGVDISSRYIDGVKNENYIIPDERQSRKLMFESATPWSIKKTTESGRVYEREGVVPEKFKQPQTVSSLMDAVMAMAQPGYIQRRGDAGDLRYAQGMPVSEIMKTPQYQMLQAMSPIYKQQAEINRLNAEAEKERALASGGGMKRQQTPEEKAREAALIAAANAAQPGTVENERLRKQEQLAQKGEAAWQSSMTDAKKLKGFLDQAIKDTDWTSAGLIGQALSTFGSTSAADLESTLDTIKAKIGFNELQQMRKESPTGGALGQVAVRELEFLQAVEGSLKQKQTPAQLKKNLGLILESTARLEEDLRKNPPDWTGQKVRMPNQMQPAERPTGAPVPVANEAEANRLPKGTLIIINGRRAIVE